MSAHEHQWRLKLHLDGCHFYQSGYDCECGATRVTADERDVKDDPYSMVWMDDSECKRCDELRKGATPKRTDEVTLP